MTLQTPTPISRRLHTSDAGAAWRNATPHFYTYESSDGELNATDIGIPKKKSLPAKTRCDCSRCR